MLKCLRTRGMSLRHWRILSQKLGLGSLDPSTLTLMKLIKLRLHNEDTKMAIIRAVCEVATKEHSANNSLDSLERDVKGFEFELHSYTTRNSGDPTLIVLRVGELITALSECQTRL